jgi:hypothetical protein
MVDSDARHRGLGARLIRELSHRAARSGARWLRLKVLPENVGAIRFYRREGFERVATDNNHDVMRIESRRVERRVAIHQPNYLPWCGFFSKCAKADVLVVLDDVQMPTGRSYVYRTRVASQAGSQWLSIPTKRGATDPIVDVQFADLMWSKKHLSTLRMQYGKRPRFKEVFEWLEALYAAPGTHLSCFNETLNRAVCDYLGLEVPSVRSSELNVTGASDDRLIALVQEVGGSVYVSGKGGQNYQAPEKFDGAGIRLDVQTYEPTPYNQGREAFEPGLSIVDALFNLGRETVSVLR